jgi:hypothetical protein
MKKFLLILTIIFTIIGIVMVYFDLDRTIRLSMTSMSDLIEMYKQKPQSSTKRIVAVIDCDTGINLGSVCNKTLKSILDQSMRLHDIAVQTSTPEKIDKNLLEVVSIHAIGTDVVRETDNSTIVLKLKNGFEYPYDYVETHLENAE